MACSHDRLKACTTSKAPSVPRLRSRATIRGTRRDILSSSRDRSPCSAESRIIALRQASSAARFPGMPGAGQRMTVNPSSREVSDFPGRKRQRQKSVSCRALVVAMVRSCPRRTSSRASSYA